MPMLSLLKYTKKDPFHTLPYTTPRYAHELTPASPSSTMIFLTLDP